MVEETNAQANDVHTDDATIASHSAIVHNPTGTSQVSPPQPLILRPGGDNSDYGSQVAYDATSRVQTPNYAPVPHNPPPGSTYANNYPQQSGSSYSTQGNYADFTNRGPSTYGGGGYPMNTQQGYQQPYTQETNKVRVTALVLVLLGVLLLLIAVILFVLQRSNTIAETKPINTLTAIISTNSTPAFSDIQPGPQYNIVINPQ
jgi:hypothetical protein